MSMPSTFTTRVVKVCSACYYDNADKKLVQPTKLQFCRLTHQSIKNDGETFYIRGFTYEK